MNDFSNRFINIITKADDERWCTTPYCTTCGSHQYINELETTIKTVEFEDICNDLIKMDLIKLKSLPNWDNCLTILFQLINPFHNKILNKWSEIKDLPLAIILFLDYYDIYNTEELLEIAYETESTSITIKLLKTLQGKAMYHSKFLKIANKLAENDKQITKLLRRHNLFL